MYLFIDVFIFSFNGLENGKLFVFLEKKVFFLIDVLGNK